MTEPHAEVKLIDPTLPRRRCSTAVILRGAQFLVIRRSATVAAPRMFCFPGGGIEGAETEAEAVCRELREELNVEIQPKRRVWRNDTRWNIEIFWWLSELMPGAIPRPNPAEVESIHWMTAEQILALDGLLESNRHFIAAVIDGEIKLD